MSGAYSHAITLATLSRRLAKSRVDRKAEIAACAAGANALTMLSRLADTIALARRQVEALEGLEESNPPSRRHLYDAIQLHTAQLRAALRALDVSGKATKT